MELEIKKRTIVDRIKKAYIAACRASDAEALAGIDISLHEDDFPQGLINFDELGTLLLAIENDPKYTDKIKLVAVDDKDGEKSRPGQKYYRIHVSHGLFSHGALSDKQPKIFLTRKWWTMSLPGKKEIRIAKQGTLTGELLGILGDTWGAKRKTDVVKDLLEERVTNQATKGRPEIGHIKDAMKEINRILKDRKYPGIKLIQDTDTLSPAWKFMLDIRPTGSKVGSSKSPKPTVLKKNKAA